MPTAFYANAVVIAVCFSLHPRLTPVAYATVYLVGELAVTTALLLVLFSIWREIRPPASVSVTSILLVVTAVALLWSGSWVYARIMMSVYALGVAGALSCTLASFSSQPRQLTRERRFALTALAAFFGIQFANISGMVAFLLPFVQPRAIIGVCGGVLCWSLFVWGLRTVPSRAEARRYERRIATATRQLWRNL